MTVPDFDGVDTYPFILGLDWSSIAIEITFYQVQWCSDEELRRYLCFGLGRITGKAAQSNSSTKTTIALDILGPPWKKVMSVNKYVLTHAMFCVRKYVTGPWNIISFQEPALLTVQSAWLRLRNKKEIIKRLHDCF